MCGKDLSDPSGSNTPSGSPPHVRERLIDYLMTQMRSRITPACAGKTPFVLILLLTVRDHPRMCGKDV